MSVIDRLADKYTEVVKLPWQQGLSGPERTWMLVYPAKDERRLRAKLELFRIATRDAGHRWIEIDFTDEFERWLAGQEYLENYFEHPEDLAMLEELLGEHLAAVVEARTENVTPDHVIALTGLGSLFGLYSVSKLIESASDHVPGRLLAFFPGERVRNNYRLLNAKDGWSYLAIPIDVLEDH
ncbi:MAG: DUF1788 domain-containing protein [Actinomycetota bacterium]|nr:DUF1788 domain-containing protein [Actinomycetota bacterium]